MKNLEYISIGIPIYNAEEYLELAILSVLSQTHQQWELILVDDGSTDNSLAIAKKYEKLDDRIRVISDGDNKKLPYRLNQIIKESKYDYIARMDADDLMHPQRLEIQLDFLSKNPQYDLVSSGLVSINSDNKVTGYRTVDVPYSDFKNLKLSYPIVHPSVLARKPWYQRNRYSQQYPRAEDYELWCRAISKEDLKLAVLPDLLLYYREEGNLEIDKTLSSYKDVLKIRLAYSHKKDISLLKDTFKTLTKILIVKGFHHTDNLQKLAAYRNKSFASDEDLALAQKTINNIINVRVNNNV